MAAGNLCEKAIGIQTRCRQYFIWGEKSGTKARLLYVQKKLKILSSLGSHREERRRISVYHRWHSTGKSWRSNIKRPTYSRTTKNPPHSHFSPLPLGNPSKILKACTTRFRNTFFPAVIRELNRPLKSYGRSSDLLTYFTTTLAVVLFFSYLHFLCSYSIIFSTLVLCYTHRP